jgi:hypothetical protein
VTLFSGVALSNGACVATVEAELGDEVYFVFADGREAGPIFLDSPQLVVSIDARLKEQVAGEGPVMVLPVISDPTQTIGYGVTRDATGAAEGGVAVQIQLTSPGEARGIYERDIKVVSSSEPATLGQVIVPLIKGASYRWQRGTGSFRTFTTGHEDTFELPRLIGS